MNRKLNSIDIAINKCDKWLLKHKIVNVILMTLTYLSVGFLLAVCIRGCYYGY